MLESCPFSAHVGDVQRIQAGTFCLPEKSAVVLVGEVSSTSNLPRAENTHLKGDMF